MQLQQPIVIDEDNNLRAGTELSHRGKDLPRASDANKHTGTVDFFGLSKFDPSAESNSSKQNTPAKKQLKKRDKKLPKSLAPIASANGLPMGSVLGLLSNKNKDRKPS